MTDLDALGFSLQRTFLNPLNDIPNHLRCQTASVMQGIICYQQSSSALEDIIHRMMPLNVDDDPCLFVLDLT